MNKNISHTDIQAIKDLLLGRRIMIAKDDQMTLDDGTIVRLHGNDGCDCGGGEYDLTRIEGHANVITNVEVMEENTSSSTTEQTTFRLFVYTDTVQTEVATFVGNDGSGWYGTGFSLHITI